MKRKNWTQEEIEKARDLLKTHSYATVGKMLHRSKKFCDRTILSRES